MKPMHETHATGAQWAWLESGVVVLARRAIRRMSQALAGAAHPAPGARASAGCVRRAEPPPFADTQASWHHL